MLIERISHMFYHDKRLQYPAHVKISDLVFARLLQ